MSIKLKRNADFTALLAASMRGGGAAEVLRVARSMGIEQERRPGQKHAKPRLAGGAVRSDCKGKTRYHDIAQAKSKKSGAEKARGVKLRVYGCSICKGYHLTRADA